MADRSHAIVAGVNKCGTTSLYRYLADHPEVCASAVKETHFFHDYVTPDRSLTYANYFRLFARCDPECKVMVEASPSYFSAGAAIARRIASVLPEAKLIIMLRDPGDRLRSYFRSAHVYGNYAADLLEGYSFDSFVREAVALARGKSVSNEKETEFVRALRQGDYATHAPQFHSIFSDSQIMYVFFEDLCSDPRRCMRDIGDFIGLSRGFFDDYDFTVENRTRNYRFLALQRLAFRANMAFERHLNRYPSFRQWLRSVYLRLNEDKKPRAEQPNQETASLIDEFYREGNRAMREFLTTRYPSLKLPEWLRPSTVGT